jgi:hypothetical protein
MLVKADVGNNRRTASTLAHSTVAETARNLVTLTLGFSFNGVRCGATQAPSSQRAVPHNSFGSLISRCAVHNAARRSDGAPLRAPLHSTSSFRWRRSYGNLRGVLLPLMVGISGTLRTSTPTKGCVMLSKGVTATALGVKQN